MAKRITKTHTISFTLGMVVTLILLFLFRWHIMAFLIWVYLRY